MPEVVYLLCVLTSILCAALLLRSYRKTRSSLLLWSMLCFVGLAIHNVLMMLDLVVLPDIDLRLVRSISGLVAMSLLVTGLVWESR